MLYVHGRAQQVEFDCETPETFCQKKKGGPHETRREQYGFIISPFPRRLCNNIGSWAGWMLVVAYSLVIKDKRKATWKNKPAANDTTNAWFSDNLL